jgi:polysaccharide export outer membrane protein
MIDRFLPFFLAVLFSFSVSAQKTPPVSELTDKQIQELIEHIESRGLSESEVELMAKARGYSNADIAIIRERIYRKKTSLESKSDVQPSVIYREQLGEVSQRTQKEDRTDTLEVKKIFGGDIFNNDRITFEPNLRVATPPDYVLGVDDELNIYISGYAVADYNLKVSPEGTVKIENLSPIYVNGMTVAAAKEKINQRLATLNSGLRNGGLKMELTLTKVKTIKVTLVGEVANPGTYSLSSLATLFNALYASGGPSQYGSFRNIQLLRNNKVITTVDIYDFLLNGSMTGNVSLQDRDVIFIPVASTTIEVSGEVRRPYLFELKPTDSIEDVIRYAGDFSEKAYLSQLKIVRSTGTEKEILTVSSENYANFLLKKGDVVKVGAILDRYTNRVEVIGAVFRPGIYAIDGNVKTVSELIKASEGLREDAYIERAILKRLGKNLDPVLLPINLDSVRRGFDISLEREDVLIIKSISELREIKTVEIQGRVNIPGKYDFAQNMSINDLIVLAGGMREGASFNRIEVSRRISDVKSGEKNVEIYTVDIDEGLSVGEGNFLLKPFDIVVVRELPNYQTQQMVTIIGEINYPGVYSIENRTERISHLIERSGGLRKDAYLKGAQFYREGKQVAVNIEDVLKNKDKSYNLFLEVGDSLYIPKEKQTIKVSGQVLNPTSVAFQEGMNFGDYIIQAGGFTDSAFVKKIYVKYPNGHVDKTRSFLTAKFHPKVEKGMEIIVPTKRRERLSKAEVISLSTGMVSLSAVLITLFNVINR